MLRTKRKRATDARLWERVEVREPHECWLWTGGTDTNGYGRMKVSGKGHEIRAHRMAYRLACSHPIEPEVVMHICDERLCCNPLHLRGGTHADNRADCVRKGRHATGSNNKGGGVRNPATGRFEVKEEGQ